MSRDILNAQEPKDRFRRDKYIGRVSDQLCVSIPDLGHRYQRSDAAMRRSLMCFLSVVLPNCVHSLVLSIAVMRLHTLGNKILSRVSEMFRAASKSGPIANMAKCTSNCGTQSARYHQ
uniref:Uncharacterized protein n=1 Tax=Parascaris equorum TaxID=6256 RepID=A0A914RGC1_PAREQ